jgi:integrase
MLTESIIKNALKKGADVQLSDGNARGTGRLILRIKQGEADWYAQQWVNDRRRLSRIGSYPTLSLAQARSEFATNHQPKIVQGEDIRNTPTTGTVQRLFNDYVAHLRAEEKRSADDVEYVLNRMAQSIGATKRANEVTSKDIIEAIRPTYSNGCKSMADHMRGYVRAAYGWAMRTQNDYRRTTADLYRLKANPASNIPTEPKVAGERWLSIEELHNLWWWKGTDHINRNTSPSNYIAVRLLMLTGQRSEEIARISSRMINRQLMLIEWNKTKNGKAHVLPITPFILSLLEQATPNENGLLFPSEVFPDRTITDQTIRKVCVVFCSRTRTEHFSPRDLRRTWKTWSGHAGISKEDRDRLQNHSKNDVSSVHYDRYDYLREKREAMTRWSEWFEQNVVNKKAT